MRALSWTVMAVLACGLAAGCAQQKQEELPVLEPADMAAPPPPVEPVTVHVETPPPPTLADPATPRMPARPAVPGGTYTVQKGDGLMSIARKVYGDAGMWRAIYEANRGTIPNQDALKIGQVLTLPAR
jgi:nucleoid-associated protein YgaU